LPPVRYIVGPNTGGVKPMTIKFAFVASPLSAQHFGVRTNTG